MPIYTLTLFTVFFVPLPPFVIRTRGGFLLVNLHQSLVHLLSLFPIFPALRDVPVPCPLFTLDFLHCLLPVFCDLSSPWSFCSLYVAYNQIRSFPSLRFHHLLTLLQSAFSSYSLLLLCKSFTHLSLSRSPHSTLLFSVFFIFFVYFLFLASLSISSLPLVCFLFLHLCHFYSLSLFLYLQPYSILCILQSVCLFPPSCFSSISQVLSCLDTSVSVVRLDYLTLFCRGY